MEFLKTTEFKVGSLVAVVLGLIVFMSLRMSEDPTGFGKAKKVQFIIPDAGGLIKNSAVKTAGIDVGVIRKIELEDGLAHVHVAVRPDIILTTSARIEIRANGILGDKYIELIPGNPNDPPLAENGLITDVKDTGSLSALMNQVGNIASSFSNVAKVLETAATKEGDRSTPIGKIINNLENFTGDLAEITSQRKNKIGEIIDGLHDVTSTLSDLVKDDGEYGFKKSWAHAMVSLHRLDASMKNIEEITNKVNSGEGTLGKLINDDTTVENVNTTLAQVGDFFGETSKLKTTLDFHSEYLQASELTKSTLGIRIQPGLDRYYEIGIVDDPTGVDEAERVTTGPPGGPATVTDTTTRYKNKVKFNALIARNFFDFTLKAGVMENTGGVGIDYLLIGNKLKWSSDLFGFEKPNFRSALKWTFYKGMYLIGGADDIMNQTEAGFSGYIGAGIYLTNDDLKLLFAGMSL